MFKRTIALYLMLCCILALSACQSESKKPAAEKVQSSGIPSVVDRETNRDRPDFKALEVSLEKDPASVIAPKALELVGGAAEFRKSVPADAKFDVLEDTWRPDGSGGSVRIIMKTQGEKIESLALLLEDVNQRWWILQTIPEDQIPDAL